MDKQELVWKRFDEFMKTAKSKTLNPIEVEKPIEPKLSKKAETIRNFLKESQFGCKIDEIRKLMEILIDEKIPPITKEKNISDNAEKYDLTFCVDKNNVVFLVNFVFTDSNTVFDACYANCTDKRDKITSIKRFANESEIDNFITLIKSVIENLGGYYYFKNLWDDETVFSEALFGPGNIKYF